MSRAEDERTVEVSRLLAGAAKTIASVRYCWLLTSARTNAMNARPMGRLSHDLEEADWTMRFITDGRSRKAAEIRRAGAAMVIVQDADDAFIMLAGTAELREQAPEVSRHWKSAYDIYFPTAEDRASAALIEVAVQRMDLWIRGITPEPFGMLPTKVARTGQGAWRLTTCDV